jgi:hypothetical protein
MLHDATPWLTVRKEKAGVPFDHGEANAFPLKF